MGKTYAFVDADALRDIVCAFTVSNASIFTNYLPNARKKQIGKNLPWEKRDLIYPAVLIGRLGVNNSFKKKRVGSELLDYIKHWFVDPDNKTGCRYLVVDAYNQPVPLAFYEANGFKYMFSSELQECEYRKIESVAKLHTRMMYFDFRPIPTLKGQEALAFALAAERAAKVRGKQDFSEQIRKADLILKEAGFI